MPEERGSRDNLWDIWKWGYKGRENTELGTQSPIQQIWIKYLATKNRDGFFLFLKALGLKPIMKDKFW